MPTETKQVYSAKVEEVYSGDDIVMMVDLGAEDLHLRKRIRLHGVDTPSAINEAHNTPAGVIRTYVRNLIRGRTVQLTVTARGSKSWVGIVELVVAGQPTANINNDLIAQGFKFNKEKAAP
ncbi:MAG: hypothetical protein RSE62_03620 [Citrobacter sp.]